MAGEASRPSDPFITSGLENRSVIASVHGQVQENETHTEPTPEKTPPPPAENTLPGGFSASVPRTRSESLPFRAHMESAFNRDLEFVHVRTGAANAMRAIGAQAAAYRSQIAFAETAPGPWIVAHELAHVIQHRVDGSPLGRKPSIALRSDTAEIEAVRTADRVARGAPAGPIGASADNTIHRFAPAHHQRATAAGLANKFSAQEIGAIYAANWERDFSQVPAVIANTVIAWTKVKSHFYKHPTDNEGFTTLAKAFEGSVSALLQASPLELIKPSLGGTSTWEHMDAPNEPKERSNADRRWEGDRNGLSGYILDARTHIKDQIVAAYNVHRLTYNEQADAGTVSSDNWGSVDPPEDYTKTTQRRSEKHVSTFYPTGYADGKVADRQPIADETSDLAASHNSRSDPNFDGETWSAVAQHLGRAMHAFEDFWSHSNWLELATQVYIREWKGDKTPPILQGKVFSNADLKTGSFQAYAQVHAIGHKLLALAQGFSTDMKVLLKVYGLDKPSDKLTSPDARIRRRVTREAPNERYPDHKVYETITFPSVHDVAFGLLDMREFSLLQLLAVGGGVLAISASDSYDIQDFLTNPKWLDSLAKLGRKMIDAGHAHAGADSHGTIAKDQPEEGKGHKGAMILAIAANRLTFGPLRGILDMPWPEAQAGVRSVLRMVDRMIQAPAVSHPLWHLVEKAITADVPSRKK